MRSSQPSILRKKRRPTSNSGVKRGPRRAEDQVRWVLVQTQAACDYAQAQPGPLPFHLGLCLPASEARRGMPPAALWRSPCFDLDGKPHFLHVNARFQMSLPSAEVAEAQPLFRLREQLLNDLIYRLHSHGARPGIISFHESEEKVEDLRRFELQNIEQAGTAQEMGNKRLDPRLHDWRADAISE